MKKEIKNNSEDIKTSEISVDEKDKKCAPGIKFDSSSCIQLPTLIKLVEAYNIENDNKITMYNNFETLNPSKYKKYLLKELNKRLNTTCSTQKCWLKQDFIKHLNEATKIELQKYTFKPDGPKGQFEWLNTINIEEVMKQYEKKFSDFKFLGAVPIDFDELPMLGIKDLDFNKLISKNIYKLGVVFNLDKHDQSGSHWVSLFSNLKQGLIYFYDSYGIKPPQEVRSFMRRIYRYCNLELKLDKKNIISDYNKIRHQFGNSECGMYSLNFILRLLDGDTFEQICNDKTPDDKINEFRKIYFY